MSRFQQGGIQFYLKKAPLASSNKKALEYHKALFDFSFNSCVSQFIYEVYFYTEPVHFNPEKISFMKPEFSKTFFSLWWTISAKLLG